MFEKIKDFLIEGLKEVRTTLPGFFIILLYVLNMITGEQFQMLNALMESLGYVVPVVGTALVATPTKRLLGR